MKPNPFTSTITFAAAGTAQAVRDGRKDVTRRLARPAKGPRWREGALSRAYEIDPRQKGQPFGELRILRVTLERLGDITEEEVRREGTAATSSEEFVALFAKLHGVGHAEAAEASVWRVEFKLERLYEVARG